MVLGFALGSARVGSIPLSAAATRRPTTRSAAWAADVEEAGRWSPWPCVATAARGGAAHPAAVIKQRWRASELLVACLAASHIATETPTDSPRPSIEGGAVASRES
jgi:hypothetical protein